MTINVNCPTCQKDVIWQASSKFRPFCSERCRLIDLGDWADENHKISQPIQQDVPLTEEMIDQLEEEVLQHSKFFIEPE